MFRQVLIPSSTMNSVCSQLAQKYLILISSVKITMSSVTVNVLLCF